MRKNWRKKTAAILAIALLTIAFAAPVNALTIASDCNKANITSCNALFEIGVCPAQAAANCGGCNVVICTDTFYNTQNTNTDSSGCSQADTASAQKTANANDDNQKVAVQSVNTSTNTAVKQSFSDYWTRFINSIKQNTTVVTKPTTANTTTNNTTTNQTPVTATPTANNTTTTNTTITNTTNNTTTSNTTTNTTADNNVSNTTTNTSTTQTSLSAQEQQMVNLVNSERAKAGLKPLTVDTKLAQMARVKSQDMADNGYFSHTSPTYGSPFDMMKTFGISYRSAGENIALNSSVERAHTALMNSDGHRANILNVSFTHIGIGIVSKGGSLYITQEFIGK